MSIRSQSAPGLAAAVLLSVALAGCGAGGNGSGAAPTSAAAAASAAPTVQKDAALAAMVPADVAADGKIIVGSDASYAPNEFVDADGTTIIGMDVDLGKAVGQKLGLDVEFQNSAFDGILPGIGAKKYEMGMSSFTDNSDREKEVDMVTYFTAGTKMATLSGNPEGLAIDNLCGKTVAAQRGTVQVDDLTARSDTCTKAGKPAITISQFQAQTDVTLALTAKRAQAMLADSPVVDYAVTQTGGQLATVGESYDTAPYGVALPKNDGTYAKAVQGAIQALITDGTYKTILDKWSVAGGAVTESKINGAG
ncbi:MAG: polar amino acid transport system substrate-binding protein [Pseudonocardiales bacterium]|nr:polar amino acid transport system substrate-binding protein [Pseudonocardiales bacterium]